MAQTIVTLCDPHLSDDVEVTGLPYRVGINLPGESRWGWYEVDLCPDHAKALTDLSLYLGEHGRAGVRPEEAGKGAHKCPECPRTFDSPQGLGIHRSRIHKHKGHR